MSTDQIEVSEEGNNKKDVFADFSPEVRERTKKMLMYFIIFAIVMLFAGFTSAYIVSNMGKYWVHIEAPPSLWISNLIIIASSGTIWMALRAMKQGKKQQSLILMAVTLLLGIFFTLTQTKAWETLSERGMGWTVSENGQGLEAYKWNSVDKIQGEYGEDYYIQKNGQQLIFNNGEYYAANDVLMTEPLTREVKQVTNSSGSYIWALIIVHVLHLVFGLIYLSINTIRIYTGVIHPGDTIRLYTNGMYWHFLGILWLYLFVFLFLIH